MDKLDYYQNVSRYGIEIMNRCGGL